MVFFTSWARNRRLSSLFIELSLERNYFSFKILNKYLILFYLFIYCVHAEALEAPVSQFFSQPAKQIEIPALCDTIRVPEAASRAPENDDRVPAQTYSELRIPLKQIGLLSTYYYPQIRAAGNSQTNLFRQRQSRCTATLVTTQLALTAAHCVYDPCRGGPATWVHFYPGQTEKIDPKNPARRLADRTFHSGAEAKKIALPKQYITLVSDIGNKENEYHASFYDFAAVYFEKPVFSDGVAFLASPFDDNFSFSQRIQIIGYPASVKYERDPYYREWTPLRLSHKPWISFASALDLKAGLARYLGVATPGNSGGLAISATTSYVPGAGSGPVGVISAMGIDEDAAAQNRLIVNSVTAPHFDSFNRPAIIDWMNRSQNGTFDGQLSPSARDDSVAIWIEPGWYWEETKPGTGFGIQVNPDGKMFMAGFMYRADGAPAWYISSGYVRADYTYEGALTEFAGGSPFSLGQIPTTSTNRAVVNLKFGASRSVDMVINGGQPRRLTRFLFNSDASTIDSYMLRLPSTGWWWDPAHPGTGFFLELNDDAFFIGIFTYGSDGNAIWYVSQGYLEAQGNFRYSLSGNLNEYAGGGTLAGDARQAVSNGSAGAFSVVFDSDINGIFQSGTSQLHLQPFPF